MTLFRVSMSEMRRGVSVRMGLKRTVTRLLRGPTAEFYPRRVCATREREEMLRQDARQTKAMIFGGRS